MQQHKDLRSRREGRMAKERERENEQLKDK